MSSIDSKLKTRAVFFTTDSGYLVPTLVAARQVIAQKDVTEVADILVFLVGFTDQLFREIEGELATTGIRFFHLDPQSYALPFTATYHKTHVPRSALARLAVGTRIPIQYEHLIYLDGDIQIVGSLMPLIQHNVQEGKILASSEHAYINWPEFGAFARRYRNYLKGIGIEDPRDYFNSGVLAARRSTWIVLSDKALAYIRSNSSVCQFHDQSALNAVCLGAREVLSPRYNFVSWYADLDMADKIMPVIIHFTGGNKPWVSAGPPWHGRFITTYKDIIIQYPVLKNFSVTDDTDGLRKTWKEKKTFAQLVFFWRAPLRRRRIQYYLRSNIFAF